MRILETVLYAENLAEAYDFYTKVLQLPVISYDPDRDLFLRLEGSVLIVFKASRTQIPDSGVPPHGTTGIGHAAFAVTSEELATWEERLIARGVPIVQKITWANGANSIYFRDPGGNVLEFATPNLWFSA